MTLDKNTINYKFSVFMLFFLFLLVGCGDNSAQKSTSSPQVQAVTGNEAQTPSAPELKVLRVPSPANEPTSPSSLIVGEELGFFKKNGIKLDFVGVIPSPQYVAALVSDRIDVSPGAHINRTIAGISAGAKILAVVGNTETTKRIPHMIGVVPKNSPIKGPKDLVGKKIGIPTIGGCNEYTPYAWLAKAGIEDPKSKIEVLVLPEKNLEQVLRQGEIDLAMLHKTPEEIVRKGEFEIVFSDYDIWGTDGGATPPYFRIDFIKQHPDTVRSFVTAVAETLNWSNANPYEARAITAKRTNTDISFINERYYTPNGIIRPETASVWIELLTAFEEIKPGVTLDQIFTNEFNPFYKTSS
ncbi:MAG: ABC transporter substrate-binding protein [Deltaproteobacteria bacterium]|jgi:ABC-type nitrate/sulfonate/bicarbonate transport system substrate-binding protein|nr:ABC transporter substrate-binding protein [Deltaproteobacteria bacterium]